MREAETASRNRGPIRWLITKICSRTLSTPSRSRRSWQDGESRNGRILKKWHPLVLEALPTRTASKNTSPSCFPKLPIGCLFTRFPRVAPDQIYRGLRMNWVPQDLYRAHHAKGIVRKNKQKIIFQHIVQYSHLKKDEWNRPRTFMVSSPS